MAGKTDKEETGLWGEDCARRFLAHKGYRILGSRVRLDSRDEIDILARDGEQLVFVEVKTRASERFGRPFRAVDRDKRHALCRAAVRYLKSKHFPEVEFRFDVVEVIGSVGDRSPEVRHIECAFQLDRRYILP